MTDHIKLSNGILMPRIALGTAPLKANETEQAHEYGEIESSLTPPQFTGFLPEKATRSLAVALDHALKSASSLETSSSSINESSSNPQGPILHIDTALFYRSHKPIAYVLNHHFMTGQLRDRSSIFITTKVFHPHNGFGTDSTCMPRNLNDMTPQHVFDVVSRHCHRCLEELNTGWIDLLLLHWPGCWESTKQHNKTKEQIKSENSKRRLAAWRALEEMYHKGWARSIGVSNFSIDHLKELIPSFQCRLDCDIDCDKSDDDYHDRPTIAPMVNQFESSIYCQFDELREFCLQNSIVPTAYSPFGNGAKHVNINNEPLLNELADKYSSHANRMISPGHIIFSYLMQKGYGTVAFWSCNEERIRSNLSYDKLPTLSVDDMSRLDGLNRDTHEEAAWLMSPDLIP